jgi:hypothetical protein
METFLERERTSQTVFKQSSPYISESARADGFYRGKSRSFCLPTEYAEQNLFPEIQSPALAYFATHKIKWHQGQNAKPNNHMCSSQVCCVNFLFPFSNKPVALAHILRPIFPIDTMLPLESGNYVAFEWIGDKDYLCEKDARKGPRTRGANCTSADAAVMFQRTDGRNQIVLIEWKYTESYNGSSLKISKSGTDRSCIYRQLFESNDCPIVKDLLPEFDSLFFEPFYQFMRQQFLANEMEKARELHADLVTVLHIAPAQNKEFRAITSPKLKKIGDSATQVWKNLVKNPDNFISVCTEQLFGNLLVEELPEIKNWLEYIQARYPWIHMR